MRSDASGAKSGLAASTAVGAAKNDANKTAAAATSFMLALKSKCWWVMM